MKLETAVKIVGALILLFCWFMFGYSVGYKHGYQRGNDSACRFFERMRDAEQKGQATKIHSVTNK